MHESEYVVAIALRPDIAQIDMAVARERLGSQLRTERTGKPLGATGERPLWTIAVSAPGLSEAGAKALRLITDAFRGVDPGGEVAYVAGRAWWTF